MKLIHDTEHDIWQFTQGESVIPLDGTNTFNSREQAIKVARQLGLAVDKTGNVAIAAKTRAQRNSNNQTPPHQSKPASGERRRITVWLDTASLELLDQLAQTHGSRGDSLRWLLAQTQRELPPT